MNYKNLIEKIFFLLANQSMHCILTIKLRQVFFLFSVSCFVIENRWINEENLIGKKICIELSCYDLQCCPLPEFEPYDCQHGTAGQHEG